MSPRARTILLAALALGAGLVLFVLLSNPQGERRSVPTAPRPAMAPPAEVAVAESGESGLSPLPAPERIDVGELEESTVLWPLRLDLDLIEADYLPREGGMVPVGSGADAILNGHVLGPDDLGTSATLSFSAGPNAGRVLKTDREGRFGAADLLPGLSIVDVKTAAGLKARREVRLRRTKETALNLSFASPGVVTGKVIDSEGKGIEGASVSIDGTPVFTDAEGNFFAGRVASGQVLVEIEHPDYAAYQELVWVASAQVAPRTELSFTLREGASLRIAIGNDVGGPGPVEVVLLPGNAGHRPPQASYRNSRFPFHRLNPIEVWPGTPKEITGLPVEVVQVFAFRPGAKAKQAVVNLRGGRPYDLKLRMKPAATISGKVLRDGVPVPGASVTLEAPDMVRATLSFLRQGSLYLETADMPVFPMARQEVFTDEQGRYRLTAWEEITPTRYLEARGPGGTGWAGRLVHRGDHEVDLELERAEFGGGLVSFDFPGRWQGLPVEVFVDGAPLEPWILPPHEDLVVRDLLEGRWHARLSWHGEPIDDVELSLRPEAYRRVELPAACIDGQDEEAWKRAGRSYPRVP